MLTSCNKDRFNAIAEANAFTGANDRHWDTRSTLVFGGLVLFWGEVLVVLSICNPLWLKCSAVK